MAGYQRASRREFLKIGVGVISMVALSPKWGFAGRAASDSSGIKLSPGVQLFIDDYLIAEQHNLRRSVNPPPVRFDHPIVTAAEDGTFQPYVSVLRDPQSKRFRMWYGVHIDDATHVAYMESKNGIDWIRPHRVLKDASPINFGNSVIDDGPGFPNPAQRYMMAWDDHGVSTAVSADGLKWISTGPQPVIKHTGDIVSLSRDPYRNRYLIIFKLDSKRSDGYKGEAPSTPEGYRRLVGQSVSDDFKSWSQPQRIIVPDSKDEGMVEFYSIGNVIARGGLLIGLLKVLRDDLSPEPRGKITGIGYTVLAWSRDGEHWERDRTPAVFMDRNSQPGTWDRAMTWGDCLLPVDDEVFIYYGGYARGHKVARYKERQLGFAKMQRDRFVSRDAGNEGGSLRTPAVTVDGGKLAVNANVKGELRVRVTDENGRALSGFDAADCRAVQGDSLAHEIQWKQRLGSLRGKAVRLEFLLKDARLYGIELMA